MNSEKVSTVGDQWSNSKAYESDMDDETKYLDWEVAGFWSKGQGKQGRNYYSDRYRDISRERDSDWRCKDNYQEKSGIYVPPDSRDSESRMEAMLPKLVKGQESQERFLEKIKADISDWTRKLCRIPL